MYLLELLKSLDHRALIWVNDGLSNSLFDAVLPWCRERWLWAPLYLFILSFGFVYWGAKKGMILLLFLVLSVGTADMTSSVAIKKNVRRLRPCNDIEMRDRVHLRLDHCGGGYSFTSSHATNHFAVAVFLIGFYGRMRRWVAPVLLFWAFTIAFSQVYVGVHYPLDVFCGGILGCLIGRGGYLIARRVLDSHWLSVNSY